MKKLLLCLLLILPFVLSGCGTIVEYTSLEEYKARIAKTDYGFSELEIDLPEYFLPSSTFLDDYAYTEGSYLLHETSPLCDLSKKKRGPDRALLVLQYEEEVYWEAKAFVLENIGVYQGKYYTYNDYRFYVNQNFMDRFEADDVSRTELTWFSMAGYNDTTHTICFLGFYNSYPKLPEKYSKDLENHFTEFIDQYFGEYYDFSQ